MFSCHLDIVAHQYKRGQWLPLKRICVYVCLCMSACMSESLCLFMPVCLSVCLSVCYSVSVCLYVRLYVCISLCMSVCLSDYLYISLYVYISVCVSVCLCVASEPVAAKFLAYNRANRTVAVLCNHQRAVPKNFDKQMENLQAKVLSVHYLLSLPFALFLFVCFCHRGCTGQR